MATDPTQQPPVKGLTKFALLRGVRDGLMVASLGLAAGNLWAAYIRTGFWHAHLDIFAPLLFIVMGLYLVVSAEVEVLRQYLHLSPKRTTNNDLNNPPVQTASGLWMIGDGVFILLRIVYYFSLPDNVFFFLILGWLACCAFFSWAFYRWRNRRATHP